MSVKRGRESKRERENEVVLVSQEFADELRVQQQRLGILNDLTADLIQHHRSSETSTEELKQKMTKLNTRWKRFNEK